MTLDYTNPNDWGKSPLTDNALKMQQFRAENPQEWETMIQEDLDSFELEIPPFTGEDFLNTHSSIDDHPYAAAFGQFLGNGIDPNTANELAFGIHSAITQISDDYDNPLRRKAVDIYDRFSEIGYWEDQEEGRGSS
jgi:hypothetical protein